jgi:uncharacterized SAM-binding protein YcdF (DUF218 family)
MSFSFLLRKLATGALLPFGVAVWLLLLALITRKRLVVALALVWLCVMSMPFTGAVLLATLEYQYARMPVQQCPNADAVLVLGGVVVDAPFGPGTVEWSDAIDRFEQAVLLFKAGKAPRLVISGGYLDWVKPPYSEAEAMRDAAVARGIPAESIVVVGKSEHTAAEAAAAAKIFRDFNIGRGILVTSAYHMPRAVMLFRRQNLDVVPFPVDFHTIKARPFQLLDFLPNSGGLTYTETAIREFYGLAYYRIFPPPQSQ